VITVNIDPVAVSLGHFAVRWYGLIVALAIVTGVAVSRRHAARRGLREDDLVDAVAWVVLAGLIGARLFHVVDHWDHEYAANPARAFYIWEGGLAIWGAVVGGLAALWIFARRRRLDFGVLVDVAAPGLVLAQAIGRLACLITGDAMGTVTTGPIGVAYVHPGAMVPDLGAFYVPTPLYEMIWNLAIFAILITLPIRERKAGTLFLVYLMLYAAGRFVISIWSGYREIGFGLNQAQILSLAALAVAGPWLVARLRRAGGHRSAASG
jgi:phosphatidylglycerol:prolipoprotein diacylglycerol transferase